MMAAMAALISTSPSVEPGWVRSTAVEVGVGVIPGARVAVCTTTVAVIAGECRAAPLAAEAGIAKAVASGIASSTTGTKA